MRLSKQHPKKNTIMEDNNNSSNSNSCNDNSSNSINTGSNERRNHRRPSDDKYFKIRNVLNIIFMIGAVIGMAVFYFSDSTMGTVIILTAMAFKIAECCFRFIRQ